MEKENQKITKFTDLRAWQEAHKLVLMVYRATRKFPKEELFALVSQMRRAAVSITSNIAEGFSRQSYKEKIQFYFMAQGSLTELHNQIIIAKDVSYVDQADYGEFESQCIVVHKIINGLIKGARLHA